MDEENFFNFHIPKKILPKKIQDLDQGEIQLRYFSEKEQVVLSQQEALDYPDKKNHALLAKIYDLVKQQQALLLAKLGHHEEQGGNEIQAKFGSSSSSSSDDDEWSI